MSWNSSGKLAATISTTKSKIIYIYNVTDCNANHR